MPSNKRKPEWGHLPASEHARFTADVERGLTDGELAEKYELRERTATNWRLRLVGPRKKGAK